MPPRKYDPRACETCGIPVVWTSKSKRRFCSKLCRPMAEQRVFSCAICATTWMDYASQARLYCSTKCSGEARSRAVAERNQHRCQHCGETFTRRGKSPKFCSRRCTLAHRTTKIERSCGWCGSQFMVKPSRRDRGQYCSRRCAVRGVHPPIIKTCGTCGRTFEASKSQVDNGVRFCSWACRGGAPSQKMPCGHCGKEIVVANHKLSKHKRFFCDRSCADLGQRTRVPKECARCGKEFERHRSHDGPYCSRACAKERKLMLNGVEITIAEAAELANVKYATMVGRLNREGIASEVTSELLHAARRAGSVYIPIAETARLRRDRRRAGPV